MRPPGVSSTHDALLFATPGAAQPTSCFVVGSRDARDSCRPPSAKRLRPRTDPGARSRPGPSNGSSPAAPSRATRCASSAGVRLAPPTPRGCRSVAYFDVRVAAPVALTIGVGSCGSCPKRRRPRPDAATVGALGVDVRVIWGMPLCRAAVARSSSRKPCALSTKVDCQGEIEPRGQRIALGTCGARNGHSAFEVRAQTMRGDPW